MRTIALIPARSGSKGIPQKNIRDFCGKPLIVWTIESALQSTVIDDVFVSTDCEHIARISELAGAKILMRPKCLSGDNTPMIDVIKHTLSVERKCENVILLQPTSPLRNSWDINRVWVKYSMSDCDSVVSVYLRDKQIRWTREGHCIDTRLNRQEIPEIFVENT